MNTLSKLFVAGLFGVLVAFAPSAGAFAAPVSGAPVVRHWHAGYWHMHALAPRYTTGYMAPTTGIAPVAGLSNDARGIAFVLAGLAGPAAFLFASPF